MSESWKTILRDWHPKPKPVVRTEIHLPCGKTACFSGDGLCEGHRAEVYTDTNLRGLQTDFGWTGSSFKALLANLTLYQRRCPRKDLFKSPIEAVKQFAKAEMVYRG